RAARPAAGRNEAPRPGPYAAEKDPRSTAEPSRGYFRNTFGKSRRTHGGTMTTIQQAPSGRQVPAGGKASPGQTAGSGGAAPKPIGLGELLRPARRRLGEAILLEAVAAGVAVVPYAAVAELARALVEDGPADRDRAWAVAAVAAGALPVWLLPAGVAGALAHRADLDFQLSVRRRLVERLGRVPLGWFGDRGARSEEHTSELQSRENLVCRHLL